MPAARTTRKTEIPAQPTAYAALMDRALTSPLPNWKNTVRVALAGLADALEAEGCDEMRAAYCAGVKDGFIQGCIAAEDAAGSGSVSK